MLSHARIQRWQGLVDVMAVATGAATLPGLIEAS